MRQLNCGASSVGAMSAPSTRIVGEPGKPAATASFPVRISRTTSEAGSMAKSAIAPRSSPNAFA